LWTNIEFGIGILAPSLVSLQPLFRLASQRLTGYFRPLSSSTVTLPQPNGAGGSGNGGRLHSKSKIPIQGENLNRAEKRTSVSITVEHKTRGDLLQSRSKERGEKWEDLGYGALGSMDEEIGVATSCWAGTGEKDLR